MSVAAQSEVPIVLGGETRALKINIFAAKKITAAFGDYIKAVAAIESAAHDAYVAIVAAGLGKDRKDVEDWVFAAGQHTLAKPLSDYVLLLSRGGQPMPTGNEPANGGAGNG